MSEEIKETVNQETERTFTQADVDRIVTERLSRESKKYEGFDELKEKAARFDEMEEASKSELQKATEKAAKLQAKVDEMVQAESVRTIRSKISASTGVPESLLTGTDEESCTAQAKAILEFAKPGKYPEVKDAGERGKPAGTASTKDQFKDWFEKQFER